MDASGIFGGLLGILLLCILVFAIILLIAILIIKCIIDYTAKKFAEEFYNRFKDTHIGGSRFDEQSNVDYDKIRELEKLHSQGSISDEEYLQGIFKKK
jgi:biopolymer transport protein ExbB/TolQ